MTHGEFGFTIPTVNGELKLSILPEASMVFTGANGSGKTRLGSHIENHFDGLETVHRIGAHRSLTLNFRQNITHTYTEAQNLLLYNNPQKVSRLQYRWGRKPATLLMSDFDHVLRALITESFRLNDAFRQELIRNPSTKPPITKLDRLKEIWERLLPHRELSIIANEIKVKNKDSTVEYEASELSDGERVIFYLIGQCLLVKENSLIIIDEPDLHIHKAIIEDLWNEIESARKDCAFLYLTHELDFAKSRSAADKFVIISYDKGKWEIDPLPKSGFFPEKTINIILGSRKPILFVEGDGSSLDANIYRNVYSDFTIIPVGSCSDVIHSVVSFNSQSELHRVRCAGIIDNDDHSEAFRKDLKKKEIKSLPVVEIENALILPSILEIICLMLNFDKTKTAENIEKIKERVLKTATDDIDGFALRKTKKRISEKFKYLSFHDKELSQLDNAFNRLKSETNTTKIFEEERQKLNKILDDKNYVKLLAVYDNKGLMAESAAVFGWKARGYSEFIIRSINTNGDYILD